MLSLARSSRIRTATPDRQGGGRVSPTFSRGLVVSLPNFGAGLSRRVVVEIRHLPASEETTGLVEPVECGGFALP